MRHEFCLRGICSGLTRSDLLVALQCVQRTWAYEKRILHLKVYWSTICTAYFLRDAARRSCWQSSRLALARLWVPSCTLHQVSICEWKRWGDKGVHQKFESLWNACTLHLQPTARSRANILFLFLVYFSGNRWDQDKKWWDMGIGLV